MAQWPSWCDGLMVTSPGEIKRRYPTYWSDGEGGIDWNLTPNIDIIALADGVIVGAGYFCKDPVNYFMPTPYPCKDPDYGVVTTRITNSDGSKTDLYYQHILIDPKIRLCNKGVASCGGQIVKKGQVIGKSNPGGWIEVGVNVGNSKNPPPYPNGWFGIWGNDPSPGPHVDPEPYIRNLCTNYNSNKATQPITLGTTSSGVSLNVVSSFNTIADSTNSVLNSVPGFKGIVEALDLIEQFQPLKLQPSTTSNDQSGVDYTIFGFDTSIPDPGKIANKVQKAITLPANSMQAFLVFVATNTAAATIRGLLILIGVICIIALIMNIQGNIAEKSSGVVSQVLPLLM